MNTNINNSEGRIIGFRCSRCDEIKSKMWGNICNSCRRIEEKHQEMLKAISSKEPNEH